MAFNNALMTITLEAGVDLSAKQFFFVSVSADGQVDPTGDGASAIGVVQNDPNAAGKAATIAIGGVTKVSAGGAITAGNAVASDAAGEAVVAASGDVILGTALADAADGDLVSILFQPRNAV